MNKTRKVELLYARAKGQASNATTQELFELKKYRVANNEESFYVTKANISAYVTAVDKGYPLSYYDWCVSNGKADKRRKGSSAEAIKSNDKSNTIGAVVAGFFPLGAGNLLAHQRCYITGCKSCNRRCCFSCTV